MKSFVTNQLLLTELPISARPKYLIHYNYLANASGYAGRTHHTVSVQYDFQEVIKTNKTRNSGLQNAVDKNPRGFFAV
jgi:hypothetical protein